VDMMLRNHAMIMVTELTVDPPVLEIIRILEKLVLHQRQTGSDAETWMQEMVALKPTSNVFNFFLAPHDLDRKNPQPALRPVSIGNSYGCPPSERCEPNSLKAASDALRAAAVWMSVSAGNSGSRCSSVSDPPAIYASVFSVGASGVNSHSIASFSSRGPVTIDRSNRMAPHITCPGTSVNGALRGSTSAYGRMSGTSMASPHLAGAIALIWQANPSYVRNIDKTWDLIKKTTVAQNSTQCSSNGSPNNVYGYGSLDVLKAVEQALKERE